MNLLSYIYDFLSTIYEDDLISDFVNEIILYGSVAKKTNDDESDIDLFFNIKDKTKIKEIEEKLRNRLKSFEVKAEKSWVLRGNVNPISFIVGILDDPIWKGLKDEIASSGIILYSNYKEMPGKTRHYHLFTYSLNNLDRKKKMKIIRKLYGYQIKKGKKLYVQKGIIDSINGQKLSSNSILIPIEDSLKIKKIFHENKVSYSVFEAWVRI